MMKPFRAFLAEQDQDYEYKLCSVENILDGEVMAQIRMALGRHGLISVEPQGVQTKIADAAARKFDKYPFMPVHVLKLVMSNPISSRSAVQSVALFTRIPETKLGLFDMKDQIVMDGAEGEQHAHPVEYPSKDAQAEVGDARAQNLVSDLMKDITKTREERSYEREVYEGVVASHREVARATGRRLDKGFYIIENRGDEGNIMVGPFAKMPINYEYASKLSLMTLGESKNSGSGLREYSVEYPETEKQDDPLDAGTRFEGNTYDVEMIDQDTGKSYTVAVRAGSERAARSRAAEIVAAQQGISKDRLIPMKPDEVAG